MKIIKLEGVSNILNFKIGKHKFMGIDLVPVISEFLKISKSEAKKLLKSGGVDITFRVQEIKSV